MARKTKEEIRLERERQEAEEKSQWEIECPGRVLDLLTQAAKTCDVSLIESAFSKIVHRLACSDLEYDQNVDLPYPSPTRRDVEEAEYFVSRVKDYREEKRRTAELRTSGLSKLSADEQKALGIKGY